jgi:membrane protein involved in colicin uptake
MKFDIAAEMNSIITSPAHQSIFARPALNKTAAKKEDKADDKEKIENEKAKAKAKAEKEKEKEKEKAKKKKKTTKKAVKVSPQISTNPILNIDL